MHEPSPSPDLADSWEEQLATAFEVLLERPLSSYDSGAVYAAYFHGNLMNEAGYDRDAAWLAPAALSGAETITLDSFYDVGEPPPHFDASESVFEFRTTAGLPPAFAADLAAACFSRRLIRGRELAPVLALHGLDAAAPGLDGSWYVCYPRLASDGSLHDAMRVATAIGHGPQSLLPFDAEADEDWQEALSAIANPELRAHLSFFCTDGTDGLGYLGTDSTGGPVLAEEGCTTVANWEECQSQIEITVVQLSDLVVGRKP